MAERAIARRSVTHSDTVMTAYRELGHQLAAMRQAAGYTQSELAPLTGYGRSTLANVETGRQNVPRAFFERCDQALTADALLASAYDEITEMITAERLEQADRAQAARDARVQAWKQEHDHSRQRPGIISFRVNVMPGQEILVDLSCQEVPQPTDSVVAEELTPAKMTVVARREHVGYAGEPPHGLRIVDRVNDR
jgi:transcriptional regulator with XRE-family HTH domain